MRSRPTRRLSLAATLILGLAASASAQTREVDTERSTLTIYAYRSGLFSAFAHNHVIRAPITRGSVSETTPLAVEILIRTSDLQVLDPTLAPHRRPEVLTRMLGPEVLHAAAYPEIRFSSTAIEPAASGGWQVSGALAIRGQSRPITFSTVNKEGRYQGTVRIKQRDFGIEPISLAGGTVKVKDEVTIVFDIALR